MKKEGLFGKSATFLELFLSRLPLTYWGIVRKMVGNNFVTILDVGCGTGVPMEIINSDKRFEATGVDIYKPYLKECKSKRIYKKLIKCDVRKLSFGNKEFDAVICFHVIEHLSNKEGLELISKLEKIAKKRVILAMPVGHLHQEAYDENEHQEHKSEWYPKDLKKLGYSVVGQGLKAIYKEENVVKKYGVFSYFIFFLSMIFQPIPSLSRTTVYI